MDHELVSCSKHESHAPPIHVGGERWQQFNRHHGEWFAFGMVWAPMCMHRPQVQQWDISDTVHMNNACFQGLCGALDLTEPCTPRRLGNHLVGLQYSVHFDLILLKRKVLQILLCLLKTIIKPSAGIETGVAMNLLWSPVLNGFAWFCMVLLW